MKKSNIAVVFDMDGTIFDSERLVLTCWERIGEKIWDSRYWRDVYELYRDEQGANTGDCLCTLREGFSV